MKIHAFSSKQVLAVHTQLVTDNVNRVAVAHAILCGGDDQVAWKHTDAMNLVPAFYKPDRDEVRAGGRE